MPLLNVKVMEGVFTPMQKQEIAHTYPLAVSLVSPHRTAGEIFEFALTGPPGIYIVLSSADLALWSELGEITNTLGRVVFADAASFASPEKFYRARATP